MHDWQIESQIKAQRETNTKRLDLLGKALDRLVELKRKASDEKDVDTQEALTDLAFNFGAAFFTTRPKRKTA